MESDISALIQLEQKDAGFERFAQDGLFLYAWLGIGMIWFNSSESKLNRVSSVFLQPISKWSIFLSNSHIRHPFSS